MTDRIDVSWLQATEAWRILMCAKRTVSQKKGKTGSNNKQVLDHHDRLIERVSDGIVVLDTKGTIRYINQKASDLRQDSSGGDLIGKDAWKGIFVDTSQTFRNACKEAEKTGKPVFTAGYNKSWGRYINTRIYPSEDGLTIYFTDVTENRIIEKELKDNLNLMEEAQEIARFGSWAIDIPSGKSQWSDEIFRILGLLKDEFSPTLKSFLQMVYPEDREAFENWFDQSFAGLKPKPLELRVITPKGDVRWIRGDGRLVHGQDGKNDRLIGFTLDITEKKYIEQLLKESEERYRLLVTSSPYVMGVIQDEEIVFTNPEAIRMFGVKSLDALLGKPVSDFFLEDQWKDLKIRIDRILDEKEKIHFVDEEELYLKDRTLTIQMTISPILFSGKPAVQIVALDITERKKNELELANQAVRRQFLIEKSRDGIVILDVDGKVIEANPRAAEMLGYTLEEFAQLSVPDWDHNISFKEVDEIIQLANDESYVFETIHTRKDGSKIDVEISANGTLFKGEKLIFTVVRDISERKQVEKEAESKQKLIEKIIRSSPIIIFILNLKEDNPEYLPYGMKNCLGYSDEQINAMQGMYTEALFHPDDIGTYRNITQKNYAILKDGEALEYEHRLRDSEGNWRDYFSRELVFSRNPDGTPAQIIGFGVDITDRKKAEKEIQQDRAFIKSILNASTDLIYIYDIVQMTNIYVNTRVETYLGYSDEEIKGMGANLVKNLMHPDDYQNYLETVVVGYSLIGEGEKIEHTFRLQRKDGVWVWFRAKESVYHRDENGKPIQIFGMMTDISDMMGG